MKQYLIGSLIVFLAGCASTFPNGKMHEEKAQEAVGKRVQFDMDCKDVQMVLISDVTRLGQQMTSMSIGVTGCEKKATYYVECVSNWGKITCTPQLNSIQAAGSPATSPEIK